MSEAEKEFNKRPKDWGPINEDEVLKILNEEITPDGSLQGLGFTIWEKGSKFCTMDGIHNARYLMAVAWWMTRESREQYSKVVNNWANDPKRRS